MIISSYKKSFFLLCNWSLQKLTLFMVHFHPVELAEVNRRI